jgi:hypothetical protein
MKEMRCKYRCTSSRRIISVLRYLSFTIPSAYELYADPKSDDVTAAPVGSPTDKKVSMAERFKEAFSHKNVVVHFVGAWYARLVHCQ